MQSSAGGEFWNIFEQVAVSVLFDTDPLSSAESAIARAGELVLVAGLGESRSLSQDRELLVLMAAVALSPRSAIDYDPSDSIPRWKHVREYLRSRRSTLLASNEEAVCRRIASVLDDLSTARSTVPASFLHSVDPNSTSHCSLCKVPFFRVAASVQSKDPFKPLHEAPEELLRAEVDHRVPISLSGTNRVANLQIVCRACNAAKGAGVDISVAAELAWAAPSSLGVVPRMHRFRMLLWGLEQAGLACSTCSRSDAELTVRLRHPDAAYVRANLRSCCYDCL